MNPLLALARLLPLVAGAAALFGTPAGAADLGVAELATHLSSERPNERLAAFLGLAQIHTGAAAAAALAGARGRLRLTAREIEALALALSGADLAQSIALLRAGEPAVVEAAVQDLGRRPPDLLKPVITGLLAEADGQALAKRILEVATRVHDPSPAHDALMLMQFEAPEEQRRVAAVSALQGGQGPDQPTAEHIAKDPSAKVRAALVPVLGLMLNHSGQGDAAVATWARDILVALAGDESASVRSQALSALTDNWTRRPPGSSPKREVALFLAALADADPGVLYIAIRHFSIYHEEASVPLIEKLCSNPEGITASVALDAVRSLGLPSLAQLAFQACSFPHPQNRWTGLEILQQLKDPRLLQVATRLLDDPDYGVRCDAQRAIAQGSGGGEGAGLALASAAKSKPSERQDLLVRLSQLDAQECQAEIAKVYQGMTPEQRSDLMRVLVRDQQLAGALGGFLLNRAMDPDPACARAAFDALRGVNGYFGCLGLGEALTRMNDPDKQLAQAARACATVSLNGRELFKGSLLITQLNPVWKEAGDDPQPAIDVAALCAAAIAAPPAEKAARFALLAGCDDERAARALREAAHSPDRTTRWAALDALVRRGDQSDATLDFALARMLTCKADDLSIRFVWPPVTPRLLERLSSFTGIADREAVARLRADIERRLAALAALEPVR